MSITRNSMYYRKAVQFAEKNTPQVLIALVLGVFLIWYFFPTKKSNKETAKKRLILSFCVNFLDAYDNDLFDEGNTSGETGRTGDASDPRGDSSSTLTPIYPPSPMKHPEFLLKEFAALLERSHRSNIPSFPNVYMDIYVFASTKTEAEEKWIRQQWQKLETIHVKKFESINAGNRHTVKSKGGSQENGENHVEKSSSSTEKNDSSVSANGEVDILRIIPEHRLMFSSSLDGRVAMVRQLGPHIHFDDSEYVVESLQGKIHSSYVWGPKFEKQIGETVRKVFYPKNE